MTDNPITQATAALYAHLDLAAEAMGAAGTSTDDHHAEIRRLAAHAMPGPDGTMLSVADLVSDLSRIVGHADVLAGGLRMARAGKPERD